MIPIGRFLMTATCSALAATALVSQQPTPTKAPAAAPAASKAPVFVVARIGDTLEVVAKDDVAARRNKLAEDHASALRKYEKDKHAAAAAKEPFYLPPPKAVTLVVTPGEYATHQLAEAALAKLKTEANEPGKPDASEKPAKGAHTAPPGKPVHGTGR